MTLPELLPYIVPPLLGALIGYLTNYVAIRMLFRPLRAWRLFGLRLPMTPGVIPAKRGELAIRMGEMVGSHLLTRGDVVRTLEQDSFRKELKSAVSDKLNQLFEREHGTIVSLVPAEFRSRFLELADAAGVKLSEIIVIYLRSDEFDQYLRIFLRQHLDQFLMLDLERTLTPEKYDRLRQHLDERLSQFLGSPEVAAAVGRFVDERTGRLLRSDKPMRALLPEDLVKLLLDQLDREIPALLEKFGGMLYDPDFRKRMAASIRQVLEKFIDSLGGLAGLLSGFIDLDKLYVKIPDALDQLSEEVAGWLREEKTRGQVSALVRERIESFLDKPLAGYVDKLPYEKVDGVRVFLRERAAGIIRSRKSVETLLGLIDEGLKSIRNRTFASLLDTAMPSGSRMAAIGALEGKALSLLRSEPVADQIRTVVGNEIRILVSEKKVGRLVTRLPSDVGQELEDIFFLQIYEVLRKEVPVLVDALNIRQMVEDKVNRLDLLEIESLLLGVMQEQFRYINLFGALLGFLIGLLNLLILQSGMF
ncbi:MAG: hypothetical protein C0623_13335 [Desulfuromonas sp.]|nr:MAG: hypothetical protein C0623_13335 [Desulfuromonas sp.]